MGADDVRPLGYQRVDASVDPQALVARMRQNAGWRATVDLRAWERHRLGLMPGDRLLDVGCGLGDAARTLAEDLGQSGEVVGIDPSIVMLDAARAGWDGACPARFEVGDARALALPSGSFDAARAERVLQWIADPQAAVTEMARVLRPDGRLSLIDTDWGSLQLDVGATDVTDAVRRAMSVERGRPSRIGRRLAELARTAGLRVVDGAQAKQVWSSWDPDTSAAPDGCFSMRELAEDVVDAGELEADRLDRFVTTVHEAARQGRFTLSLTMYAIVAARLAMPS